MRATLLAISTAVIFAFQAQAQQSPSPSTPQTQTAPCTTGAPAATPTQNSKSNPTFINRLKKKLDDESAKLTIQSGIPVPNSSDLDSVLSTKPAPCPPKAAVPAQPTAAAQPAPVKLPPDMTVTLHCNPMTPSPHGGVRQTTLTLPDPKDFAVPKATDFLVDSVVPDIAAKTPCYQIKVDPKTGRSFAQ